MDVSSILKRAAEKAGSVRVRFLEKNLPTSVSNISILPFFGDTRSKMIMSSLLLKRYREELKGSRYFIVLSWPGDEFLYPFVNEYWTLKEDAPLDRLYSHANGFSNTSDINVLTHRALNYFFEDVIDPVSFESFYKNGLKEIFFQKFREVKKYFPTIPSSMALGAQTAKAISGHAKNVFVEPVKTLRSWQQGQVEQVKVPKLFWETLGKKLVGAGYLPVFYTHPGTYDISSDLAGTCVFLTEADISLVLTAMRATGCVLDVFSGISRLALIARSPFIACDERARYIAQKEYEIDDLCAQGLAREYIFSFPTIIQHGDVEDWNSSIFEAIMARLDKFLPSLDRDRWPTVSEVEEVVDYDVVRKHVAKRLGTKFFKVNRD